jgi:hypothetical protein
MNITVVKINKIVINLSLYSVLHCMILLYKAINLLDINLLINIDSKSVFFYI